MKCRCGWAKLDWQAFCTDCYSLLPDALKPAFRERDETRLAAAVAWLEAWDAEKAAQREQILGWGRKARVADDAK